MSEERERLDELRRAFDAGFAAPPTEPAERVDLIALRAGRLLCAVRISEIARVAPLRGIAPLPCREPSLLGVASVRGSVVPVYDLAALAADGASRSPRWMLLSAGADRVALAFDEIEEYLRVVPDQLVAASEVGSAGRPVAAEAVRVGSSLRPVVSVASVLRHLKLRLDLLSKER
jgi:purine-binding chemotaxis protein CheW